MDDGARFGNPALGTSSRAGIAQYSGPVAHRLHFLNAVVLCLLVRLCLKTAMAR